MSTTGIGHPGRIGARPGGDGPAKEEEEAWELSRVGVPDPLQRGRILSFARRSSLHRFWGAFLREFPERVVPDGGPRRPALRVDGPRASLRCAVLGESPLGRLELGALSRSESGASVELATVGAFADAFRAVSPFPGESGEALLSDLAGSHANLLLALCLREGWRGEFAEEYRMFLDGRVEDPAGFAARCESWCATGHPFHPTPKSRGGMSLDEVARMSPESGLPIEVAFAAVSPEHADFGHADGMDPAAFLRSAFAPDLLGRLRESALRNGADLDRDLLVPFHPWQLRHLEPADVERLRFLDPAMPARPLLSFRTVQAEGCTRLVKLPLHACLTSALRQLSPRSVRHATAMSRTISGIASSGLLPPSLRIQRDEAFVLLSRRSGAIFRDPAGPLIPDGCAAFPAAFLVEESPANPGRTVLSDLLSRFADDADLPPADAAAEFLRRYARATCPGILRLLSAHGIGCEAHMQNSVALFRRGDPIGVVLRDFEDLPLCMERFRPLHPGSGVAEGSWNLPEGPDLARKVVIHSLVHVHLGLLVLHLARLVGQPERSLWDVLSEEIADAFGSIAADGFPGADEDLAAFFSERTEIKCLLRMKLAGQVGNEFVHRPVPNPLRRPPNG